MKNIIKSHYVKSIFYIMACLVLGCKDKVDESYFVSVNKDSSCKEILKLTYDALIKKDTVQFSILNKQAEELAIKTNDSLAIAEVNWNYGSDYGYKEKYDVAYQHFDKAYKIYKSVGYKNYAAKMQYNKAFALGALNDYVGAEILTIEALKEFVKINNERNIYLCYKYLGTLNVKLEDYDTAISYHEKALKVLGNIELSGANLESSYNSIGVLYKTKGNYKKAIEYFNKGLTSKVKDQNKRLHASILINLTHSRLLIRDTVGVYTDMLNAKSIIKSEKYAEGSLVNNFHLSDYHLLKKDTIKAIADLKKVISQSSQKNYGEYYLKSLIQLSKLDKQNSSGYLHKYIAVKDSLHLAERKVRNKFARLRFETDEFAAKSEELSKENRNLTIFVVIGSLLFTVIFFLKQQLNRNKELIFDRGQQLANQEIFALLLQQQSNLEDGKQAERTRISEDLHDGVLGRLFGTRISLGLMVPKVDKKYQEDFTVLTESLHNVEKEIRNISHDLKSDLFASTFSFVSVITQMLKTDEKIGGFTIDLNMDDTIIWGEVSNVIKVNFYRMLQESLLNIIKYARAKHITVNFNLDKGFIHLEIKDDGVGFDVKKSKKGIGHKNMASRVAKLNGFFNLESNSSVGTTVIIRVPLNNSKDV